jgi:hypothetical protein
MSRGLYKMVDRAAPNEVEKLCKNISAAKDKINIHEENIAMLLEGA